MKVIYLQFVCNNKAAGCTETFVGMSGRAGNHDNAWNVKCGLARSDW
jgi:hypothetical protein